MNQDVMTANAVAQWLGVDRKTVYAAVAAKTIPHQRLGKRVIFSRAAIEEWLARVPA